MIVSKKLKSLVTASCLAVAAMSVGTANAADLDSFSGVCQLGNAKFFISLNQIQGALYGSAQSAFSDDGTNIRIRVNGQKFNVGRGSPSRSNSIAIRAPVKGRGKVVRVRATGRGSAFDSCRLVLRAQ